MRLSFNTGFTLTELLVGLGILGLIAAFAVPKILTASAATTANAKVHKAAQAVVNGYEKWTQENGKTPNTSVQNVMSMVQHNGQITDGRVVDWAPNSSLDQISCVAYVGNVAQALCYLMPDSSIILFVNHFGGSSGTDLNFSNSGTTNALYFAVDPDGKDGPQDKSATTVSTLFLLSYNGRLRERGRLKNSTYSLQPQYTPDYYIQ